MSFLKSSSGYISRFNLDMRARAPCPYKGTRKGCPYTRFQLM